MRRSFPRLFAFAASLLLLAGCATSQAPAGAIAPAAKPAKAQPSATATAKETPPPRVLQPMLWRISGKQLAAPSYLFGTIHLSDPRILQMHPLSRQAFKQSASLHTEVAFDPKTQMAMTMDMLRKDGKKLDEDVGPELAKRLDEELKHINPALNAAPFQFLKTWAVAVVLPTLADQLNGGTPLDMVLWQKAAKAGKRCVGLESIKEHLGALETLSDQEQTLMLKGSLDMLANGRTHEKPEQDMKQLVNLYLQGDLEQVRQLMDGMEKDPSLTQAEKDLSAKLNHLLLDARNVGMAANILKELQDKPEESHFFAAGTAHFTGAGNIRELLAQAGYVVEQVEAPKQP